MAFSRRVTEPTLAVIAIVYFLVSGVTVVKAAVSTSKLQVHIPQSLEMENGYDHRDALFGLPPYGGSIQAKVYYTNNALCSAVVDTSTGFPVETDEDGNRIPWQSPYILMMDRGNCTFVQKTRNAQKSGAAAVLIADSVCLCGAEDCTNAPDQTECEMQEPIMADDGSGADISIPSFLVFKQDADRMKKVLKENQPVRVEMSFSVPSPDARVEYDLWTSAADTTSRTFLQHFKEAALALGEHAFFTPHMYIYDGVAAGCRGSIDEFSCDSLCTNGGRYCSTTSDNGVTGEDVVAESLRRMCIWNEYGEDGIAAVWYDYVTEFLLRCDNPARPGFFSKEECIEDAMETASVDKSAIDQCMVASGGLDGDVANTILDKALSDIQQTGVFVIPSVFVNQGPLRGTLEFGTVFRAICSGFAAGYQPSVCKMCAHCHDGLTCVKEGSCRSGVDGSVGVSRGGIDPIFFVGSLLSIVVCFCVVGYVMYQRQQRRMRDEIRGIMAEYMPVGSNKNQVDTSVSNDAESEFTIN